MGIVKVIEDGDARAFQAGNDGTPFAFRSEEMGELTVAFRKAVADAVRKGLTADLDDSERGVARELAEQVGIRKDAADSLMIAWYPPKELAAQLAGLLPGGQNADDLHLTILYLGDPDQDGSGPWDPTHIAAVVKILSKMCYPLDCQIGGIGRFVGPDDTDAIVALVDSPDLICLKQCLLDELCCYGAIPYNSPALLPAHGFIPHITLGFIPKDQRPDIALNSTVEFKLDSLSVAVGAQHATFAFEPMAEDAVEDFASYYEAQKSARRGTPAIAAPDPVDEPILEQALKAGALDAPEDPGATYAITKASAELRYTLGPLYAPMRKDGHGEYVESDELQQAAWDYVRMSSAEGRRIHLQHDTFGQVTVGEWVECMAWPYDHEITLTKADGTSTQQPMPAGTVYLGVQWDPEAWELVKSGKLGGYSLGGRAIKVEMDADLPDMGYRKPE